MTTQSIDNARTARIEAIREESEALGREAAELNLITAAEEFRQGWPTAAVIVVEIDFTDNPITVTTEEIRDAAGNVLWPTPPRSEWRAGVATDQWLANAYSWSPGIFGDPVDDDGDGHETFHVTLPATA